MKIWVLLCSVTLLVAPLRGQETVAASNATAQGDFRVAMVDIQSLCATYRKTIATEREIDLVRAEIQKTSQLMANEIEKKKKILEQQVFRVRRGEASEEEEAKLKREFPLKQREIQMDVNNRLEKRSQANLKLNQQMVRRMAVIVEEIVALTAQKTEEMGYDLVVDSSGRNSNQVAPMLFANHAEDVTELIRKELSKNPSGDR